MLNKVWFILIFLFSTSSYASLKMCDDPVAIDSFIKDHTKISQLRDCAHKTKQPNLGFKQSNQTILILDSNIDNKIFFFSFPMIHSVNFFHYRNKELIAKKSYSKVNNEGNEYIYLDNIGSKHNIILALVNTKSSVQLPYRLFNSHIQFNDFLKTRHLFDGLWFGIIFFTLILTYAFFYIRRKSEIIYYSMHITALFIIQLAFSGYLFSHFSFLPEYLKHRAVVFACSLLTYGTVSLIYQTFIRQRPKDKILTAYKYVTPLAVVHFIISAIFYNQTTIILTSALTLILSVSSIVICLYAITRKLKYSYSFLFSFSLFLFSSLVFTLKDIGLLNINEIEANYLVKLSLLVEIFVIGSVLVRTLFEEAKLITKSKMSHIIASSNVKIISKLQHDIQSPLTYLDHFFDEVKTAISEDLRNEGRQAIDRVQDIVNGLRIDEDKTRITENSNKEVLAIYPLLKRIISEKRNEHKSKKDINITLNHSIDYDIFVNTNKSNFNRAISNIINNAIESKHDLLPLEISISLKIEHEKIKLYINDNGVGIKHDKLNSIFEYGKSFNKEGGSGLGLYQAKEYLDSENGSIDIRSDLKLGSSVIITLIEQPAPSWALKAIHTTSNSVIIIDDDESIHSLWRTKLPDSNYLLKHFYNSQDFENWAAESALEKHFFIFDYELLGSKLNGIELIKNHNLQKNSILATSHFMDQDIQKECNKYNLKMISKESVRYIDLQSHSITNYKQMVLIDNDDFVHLSWKRYLSKFNIELISFLSIDDFLSNSDYLQKRVPIYLDSNLDNDIKGEIEGIKIVEKGFTNISMTTGYPASSIEKPEWIHTIINKSPERVNFVLETNHKGSLHE